MERFIFHERDVVSVGLFGLGRSNLGVMSYLSERYPHLSFTLRQDRPLSLKGPHLSGRFGKIFIGKNSLDDIREDILFLSPTVKRDRLSRCGAILTSDAEFFFDGVKYPIFAVTGSDGKSTTVTLTSLLLSDGGRRAPAIGNIGVAMTPMLGVKNDFAAAELSSFQLMSFSPRVKRAYVTNITPNHLDFHSSFEEYAFAKARIYENAEEIIVNLDDSVSLSLLPRDRLYAAVSDSLPFCEAVKRVKAEIYITVEDGYILKNGSVLFDTRKMRCRNRHTVENLAAAIAITDGYTSCERINAVGREFSGLPHRCELIGEFCGVKYFNSSIDSTPQRTATTLDSLGGGLIVILGGKGKGLSYEPLLSPLKAHARAVVLTGANGCEIADTIKRDRSLSDLKIYMKDSFYDAVMAAIGAASPGDTVILSPASTSFDAFRDFAERGNKFKEIVTNYYYKV